jgi:hypothetical protein
MRVKLLTAENAENNRREREEKLVTANTQRTVAKGDKESSQQRGMERIGRSGDRAIG